MVHSLHIKAKKSVFILLLVLCHMCWYMDVKFTIKKICLSYTRI